MGQKCTSGILLHRRKLTIWISLCPKCIYIEYDDLFQLEGFFASPHEFDVNEVIIDDSVKSPPPPVGPMSENLITRNVVDDIHSYAHNCMFKIEVQKLKLDNSQLRLQNGHLKRSLTILEKKFNNRKLFSIKNNADF